MDGSGASKRTVGSTLYHLEGPIPTVRMVSLIGIGGGLCQGYVRQASRPYLYVGRMDRMCIMCTVDFCLF